MTLDDLMDTYAAAYHLSHDGQHRAGIRAVVECIRDAIREPWGWGMDLLECEALFDEILAPRGDEAAGGSTSNAERQSDADGASFLPRTADGLIPAPAAAPDAVCEWEQVGVTERRVGCNRMLKYPYSKHYITPSNGKCPYCKWPIKFVEAAR